MCCWCDWLEDATVLSFRWHREYSLAYGVFKWRSVNCCVYTLIAVHNNFLLALSILFLWNVCQSNTNQLSWHQLDCISWNHPKHGDLTIRYLLGIECTDWKINSVCQICISVKINMLFSLIIFTIMKSTCFNNHNTSLLPLCQLILSVSNKFNPIEVLKN